MVTKVETSITPASVPSPKIVKRIRFIVEGLIILETIKHEHPINGHWHSRKEWAAM